MQHHNFREGFKLIAVLISVVAFIGLILIMSPAIAGK